MREKISTLATRLPDRLGKTKTRQSFLESAYVDADGVTRAHFGVMEVDHGAIERAAPNDGDEINAVVVKCDDGVYRPDIDNATWAKPNTGRPKEDA